MTNEPAFSPTEIWDPESNTFHFEEAIADARDQMNSENPEQLIHELKGTVRHSDNGIVYATLKGRRPEEYSDTDALVLFNPFANTATANSLVKAEFIRRVAKNSDVRDDKGKLKPVIMLASPGIFGSKLNLTGEEKKEIRGGDLGPAAREFLKAVSAQDYGRVALLGFSQGASMALAGALQAESANLDTDTMGIAEPPNVTDRAWHKMGRDFFASMSQQQDSITAAGLRAQERAIGKHNLSYARSRDLIRFGAVALTPTNLAIWAAFDKNGFERDMQKILDDGLVNRAVVGYGSKGKVAPVSKIEPSLAKLHQQVAHDRLLSIKVQGKDHTWGDNLPLLAKLYLRAMV